MATQYHADRFNRILAAAQLALVAFAWLALGPAPAAAVGLIWPAAELTADWLVRRG